MMGVFGSFVLNGDPTVKQFGVGLAVAVALAASAVLALTPALMALMRRGTWWLPAWLDGALPHMDIEGARVLGRRRGPPPAVTPEPVSPVAAGTPEAADAPATGATAPDRPAPEPPALEPAPEPPPAG
jgi:hypothetical protein